MDDLSKRKSPTRQREALSSYLSKWSVTESAEKSTLTKLNAFSSFATAQVLDVMGYRPIPINPRSKKPAVNAWQNGVSLDDPAWRVPFGGVGVVLGDEVKPGLHLVGVDLDSEDLDLRQRLIAELPKAPTRRGKKGVMLFALAKVPKKREWKLANGGQIEILTAGQQAVIPPSVHPDTGRAYEWCYADTLENTAIEALPIIDDIDALIHKITLEGKLLLQVAKAPSDARIKLETNWPLAPIETLKALLEPIDADDRETWLHIGAACFNTYRDTDLEAEAQEAFDDWAAKSDKWKDGETERKWSEDDFGKLEKISFGTVVKLHRDAGGKVAWPPFDMGAAVKADVASGGMKPSHPTPSQPAQGRQTPGKRPAESPAVGMTIRRASDIAPRRVNWLWLHRIAEGKLTLIGGHPGTGKTQIALDIAARVSKGASFPCGWPAQQGNVIVLSAEDDASDTIVPRLLAADADLNRVHIVDAVRNAEGQERQFSLVQDVTILQATIEALGGCKLIVVDVIDSYMGNTDSHRNAAVRGVLGPLAKLAERHRCAIIGLTHFSKQAGDAAVLKFTGSIGFVGQARSAWIVAPERKEDGEHTGRYLFLAAKNNLAKAVNGYAYTIEGCTVKDGAIPTSRVQWREGVAITADEAVAPIVQHKDGPIRGAVDFLRQELRNGPVAVTELKKRCKGAGLSWRTVERAKNKLQIHAGRKEGVGGQGHWEWRLQG
jgi:putative DNA primase/helicase